MKTPIRPFNSSDLAFIDGLINQPWARDGRHCWRLAREIIARFGYELPLVMSAAPGGGKEGRETKARAFREHPERALWTEVIHPTDWALALMHHTSRRREIIEHAGVYVPARGGCVVHTNTPHGVVFDRMPDLIGIRHWQPIFLVPSA